MGEKTFHITAPDGQTRLVLKSAHEVTPYYNGPYNLRVKRIDPRAKLPTRGTDGAAGLDLYALEDVVLTPGRVHRVRTGVAIEVPRGYEGQVRPRSGLTSRGVFVELGTIDSDYRGEVGVMMHAYATDTGGYDAWYGHPGVAAGDRVAQLIIAPAPRFEPVEVEELTETQRGEGGFGSTGR